MVTNSSAFQTNYLRAGILAISNFISQNAKSPLDVTWRGEASLESDGAAGASSALLSGG